MSLVVAFDEIKPEQVKRNTRGNKTVVTSNFCRATIDEPYSPSAYLNKSEPGRKSSAHFHIADQFQIIVEGKGKFGRHDVAPYCVHFSRAYTAYGPLLVDEEAGWAFMTLRSRYDPGQQRLPGAADVLKKVPNRRPWQVSKHVTFPAAASGVKMEEVPEIKDDHGLFVYALTMAPHTRTLAPDPSRGDGQFVVVLKGSMVNSDRERNSLTVAFVRPDERPLEIQAGAQGLEALVLNLPQVNARAAENKAPSTATRLTKWQCLLCSFTYDEALGLPEEGIAAGTRWADVPDTWGCPDCSASKGDFEMVEV